MQGAEEERHARRALRSATPPATPMAGCTGVCGRTAATSSTRTTRSSSIRRRPRRRWNIARQLSDTFIPGVRVLERLLQQQGVPRRRNPLDRQRHLDLRRRQETDPTKKAIADDMDHALFPGRAGRQADRTAAAVPDPGDELHEISERREGLHRLHAGSGAVQSLADGAQGYLTPYASTPTTRIRSGPRTRRRTVFRDAAKRSLTAAASAPWREGGGRDRRLHRRRHVRAATAPAAKTPRATMKIAERQLQRIYQVSSSPRVRERRPQAA